MEDQTQNLPFPPINFRYAPAGNICKIRMKININII